VIGDHVDGDRDHVFHHTMVAAFRKGKQRTRPSSASINSEDRSDLQRWLRPPSMSTSVKRPLPTRSHKGHDGVESKFVDDHVAVADKQG
jgi:hypothetical protein